jgi:hypothetical protein
MINEKWYGGDVKRRIEAKLVMNARRAAQEWFRQTKININRPQPTRGAGAGRIGLEPSKPGEFPKRVTSEMFRRMTTAVVSTPTTVELHVGTNVHYAEYHEYGKRPFISRTLAENYHRIIAILRGSL